MIHCPICNHDCDDSAKKCPRCGTPQPPPAPLLSPPVRVRRLFALLSKAFTVTADSLACLIWLFAVVGLVVTGSATEAIKAGFIAVMAMLFLLRRR